MNVIMEMLMKIKRRPGIYLTKKSLNELYLFMYAYQLRDAEITGDCEGLLPGFQDFIQKKYKTKASASWASIINGNESTDDTAFDSFYVLLDEFLKEDPAKKN